MDSNKLIEVLMLKVDKLDSRLDGIDVTLAKQHEQLVEHIKRTKIAEENIKHINKHVNMMEGGLKAFGAISAVLGILKLLGLL